MKAIPAVPVVVSPNGKKLWGLEEALPIQILPVANMCHGNDMEFQKVLYVESLLGHLQKFERKKVERIWKQM